MFSNLASIPRLSPAEPNLKRSAVASHACRVDASSPDVPPVCRSLRRDPCDVTEPVITAGPSLGPNANHLRPMAAGEM